MRLNNINKSCLNERQATIIDNLTCAYHATLATNTVNDKIKQLITRDINTLFSYIIAKEINEEISSHLLLYTYAMVVPGKHAIGENAMRDICMQHWKQAKFYIRGLRYLYNIIKQNVL